MGNKDIKASETLKWCSASPEKNTAQVVICDNGYQPVNDNNSCEGGGRVDKSIDSRKDKQDTEDEFQPSGF